MTTIDLSLANEALYKGCEMTITAGRNVLITPISEAVHLVGKNAADIVAADGRRDEVMLTGAMAVWAYMIVFHEVVHRYRRVWYNDGRNEPVLIAAHG
ncbi:MAG: hypothetical protein ACK5XN_40120 [Bacteroidota bacterium]|jgi:hypothetical protein